MLPTNLHRGWGQPCSPRSLLAKVPVVKEELLSCLDGSLGEDTNAVVSVHHDNCNQRHNTRDKTSEMCSSQPGPWAGALAAPCPAWPSWAGVLTFRIAVGVHRVVGKADFISFASSINNKIY